MVRLQARPEGKRGKQSTRKAPSNPLIGNYRCRDGRHIWLLGYEAERHWPGFVKALAQPQWLQDARFSTAALRAKNGQALVAEMDTLFAARDAEEWHTILDEHGCWWQPVQSLEEVVADPQAQPGFVTIPAGTMDTECLLFPPSLCPCSC